MRSRQKRVRPAFQKISKEELAAWYEKFSKEHPYPGDWCTALSGAIVSRFLGQDWIKRHVLVESKHAKYLRVDIAAPLPEKAHALLRYFEFAETLLNLQNVEGFEECLEKLFYGDVESACAELDVARLLHLYRLRFKFIKPRQAKTRDYDIEVFYPDGFRVFAEAKCKFESTPLRPESITNSMRDAREQLPANQPGIIFVKVPQRWIEDISLAKQIVQVAEEFMVGTSRAPGTDRVKSVKFYCAVTLFDDTYTSRVHLYKEVSNPKFPGRDWDMFDDYRNRILGMPSWWTTIYPQFRMGI